MSPVLATRKARPWTLPSGGKGVFSAAGYHLGKGKTPIEVALASSPSRPTESDVRNLWKRRRGNQPSPLLLVVTWPGASGTRATVCGASGEDPAVYSDRDPDQISRIATLALDEPDHHAAVRFLSAYLPEEAGGLRNVALFATHHLIERVPRRPDWSDLCKQGHQMLGLRREQLVQALGFVLEPRGQAAVLRATGRARALAVFLDDTDNPDASSPRFNGMTAVSWAIASAAADNIPYVIVTRGPQIRIYTTRAGAGAAGKGGSSAFVEINLPLLTEADAGYLPLLCAATSLADDGIFETLLEDSHNFAAALGGRLQSRIYDHAIPHIAQALIDRHADASGATDDKTLNGLYDRSLLVLFRLLFVAYAEDRELLPLRTNGLYRQRSLKHSARELSDLANAHGWDAVPFDENATDLWDGVRALWAAVDHGRVEWNVPRYNGGMFSSDATVNPEGAVLAELQLTNAEIGPALLNLLVDQSDDVWGPIDFASLDVREFGTIYEGLLESGLAVAPCDLTVAKDDTWVPASAKDDVYVDTGGVYLHNKSGARKASGSYFTKPFAVNHLLDHALEPALAAHVQRLEALHASGDETAVAEAFFDFRCVDLSMGSGHFLVAATDRVERRLSEFLADHQVPGVFDELSRLSTAAAANLVAAGLVSEGVDTNTLLRRQIARRCVYGVDVNPTAVELARLALWIHTFVKGLPLTSLNHGLVVGNSLTGMGTLDEALDVLDPDDGSGNVSFVRPVITDALEDARDALARFAATSEATAAEVREARKAHQEAEVAVVPARKLLDLAVAARIGAATIPIVFDGPGLLAAADSSGAADIAKGLAALHLPVAFPEVFLRDRPGFDCILGNPPWDEATIEELGFWSARFPGLKRGLKPADQKREVDRLRVERPDMVAEFGELKRETDTIRAALVAGPYPGMGTGDPDLYKAFTWRFWHAARTGGQIGVVLPRSALTTNGSATWRKNVLTEGSFQDVTVLLNTRGWVFDDLEHRDYVALVTIAKEVPDATLPMRGPYANLANYQAGLREQPARFEVQGFLSWSEDASFPLLPTRRSVDVFLKLREHPRLDADGDWQTRPYTELHATNDKLAKGGIIDVSSSGGPEEWPVYKGESFDIWIPETGTVYGWASSDAAVRALQSKRLRARSAFDGFPQKTLENQDTLPCLAPRIAFRDITHPTNTRTVIAALVPPHVLLANKAPFLLWPKGDERDEAYLLGVLCSIPLDWYARKLVKTSLNYYLLRPFPVPRPDRDHPLRREIERAAGRLAAVDARYAGWAGQVGVPVGSVAADQKRDLVSRIDAAVALLYGLDEDDITHVFETFHEGWDYTLRLAGVVDHMRSLEGRRT